MSTFPLGAAGALSFYDPLEGTEISDKWNMLSLLPTCAFQRDIPKVRIGWLAPLIWKPLRVNVEQEVMLCIMRRKQLHNRVPGSIHPVLSRSSVTE